MEQMTVNITRYKEHSEEVYKAWKEVWNEYSKEFVDATDVKFLWAYQAVSYTHLTLPTNREV